jgi:transcriptional regulator with XRE-family HTH domain
MPPNPDSQSPAVIALGSAIRFLRQERNLTQEELGRRAEIHPTWISQIERGRVNPTFSNLRRVSRGLEVSLPDLAGLAEEMER